MVDKTATVGTVKKQMENYLDKVLDKKRSQTQLTKEQPTAAALKQTFGMKPKKPIDELVPFSVDKRDMCFKSK